MIVTCANPDCAISFYAPPHLKTAKYCSKTCNAKMQCRQFNVQALRLEASRGDRMNLIAKRLGADPQIVREAMRRAGVYEQWREQRWM